MWKPRSHESQNSISSWKETAGMCEGCSYGTRNTHPSLKVFWKCKPNCARRRLYKSEGKPANPQGCTKWIYLQTNNTENGACYEAYVTLYLQHFSPVFDRSCRFCIQYTAIVISSHLRLIRGKTSDKTDALQKQSEKYFSKTHFHQRWLCESGLSIYSQSKVKYYHITSLQTMLGLSVGHKLSKNSMIKHLSH